MAQSIKLCFLGTGQFLGSNDSNSAASCPSQSYCDKIQSPGERMGTEQKLSELSSPSISSDHLPSNWRLDQGL